MELRERVKSILKLEIDREGEHIIYHSEDWALLDGRSIAKDLNGVKWIRHSGKRRAVMKTGKPSPAPFTKLIAGRR
jgi:hypothetical protein